MTIVPDTQHLLLVIMISARVGTFFIASPLWKSVSMPSSVKVMLVIAFSYVLSTHATPLHIEASDVATLLTTLMAEMAIGLVMALAVHCAFAVFAIAGRLVDTQIGFGLGGVYDPITQRQSPVIVTAFELLAVLVFFLFDGHVLVVQALLFSIERLPVGFSIDWKQALIVGEVAGLSFSLALMLILPVVLILFLVDLGVAVLSRNLPQMNIFAVGIPVKLVAGLGLLAIALPYLGTSFARVFQTMFRYMTGWMT